MKTDYYKIVVVLGTLLVLYLHLWGIDRLVLGSDELHPARALISDDWSLTVHPWPADAVREYYDNWPIQFPPLFGLMVRAAVVLLGVTHVALRIVPAIFSLLAIGAIFLLFKQFLKNGYVFGFTLLLAMLSDKMLIYAKSLKHYTLDIFFATLILAFGKMLGDRFENKTWIGFTIISAISIWFAFASIYAVAAVYLFLFVRYVFLKQHRNSGFWYKIILSGLVFTASFAGLYVTSISNAVSNPVFLKEWLVQIFQWDRATDLGYLVKYFGHVGKHVLILPAYFFFDSLLVALIGDILIAVWIWDRFKQKQWDKVLLLVTPLLLVILASLAGKYPFSAGRLTLFLMPAWSVMMLLGAQIVYARLKAKQIWFGRIAIVAVTALVLTGVWLNINNVSNLKYSGGRNVDQLMYALKANAQDGDTVYVHWGAIMPFYFYFTDHQPGYQNEYPIRSANEKIHVIWGEEHTLHPENNEPLFERIEQVPGRLWITFGHLWPTKDMKLLETRLNEKRTLLEEKSFKGCKLLLYDKLPSDKAENRN